MYGMVLMVAVAGTPDTASFGKKGTGCTGGYACSGGGGGGFLGMRNGNGCNGGGFLGGLCHKNSNGCSGYVAPACGCTGGYAAPVVVAPQPAPVVMAAPCNTCAAPAPVCCDNGGRKGLFGGLCKKKNNNNCCPAPTCNTCAAPVAAPCCGGAVAGPIAMPVPGGPVVGGGTAVPEPLPMKK